MVRHFPFVMPLGLVALAAACSSGSKAPISQPTLTSVVPATVCTSAAVLSLGGTGFQAGASVRMGTVPAHSVSVQSSTAATASFASGLPVGGPYDVTLTNPDGGAATRSQAVRVVADLQVFYVDPPTVYNGISVEATVYGSGFTPPVQSVTVAPSTGGSSTSLAISYDASHPNQIQVTVPAGMAAGGYDLDVRDGTGCTGHLANAFQVTATTSLVLGPLDPAFGWSGADTAVTVTATSSPGFSPVPRLYLNPHTLGPGTVAAALGAVAYYSPTTLSAVVPSGLPAGSYDLIAVNPDGTVGFLANAFTVNSLPPPTISSLSPGTLPTGSVQSFTILGDDFRTPAVTLTCEDSTGAAVAAPPVTVSSFTATQVSASVNAAAGVAVCVVQVTDGDDLSYADFSALVFTNPAANLYASRSGPSLSVARRAPVALGGDATSVARFLHVAGGDDGAGVAYDTVESAPLDMFGVPSPFFVQRTRIAQARAFAGGTLIGRFLYLAGGSAGGSALNTVERAYVLDPAQRGQVADLFLAIDLGSSGLAPGLWYYRVSAVMGSNDAFNPGGENLPSDPFPVRLPDLGGGKRFDVTVSWQAVAGAAKYRVYRSLSAGATVGTEEVIAEVAAPSTSYTDAGAAPISTDTPLPVGSLGAWRTLAATLSVPREGPGVSWAVDPNDATAAYLYVIGGRQNATTASKTYEFLHLALGADGSQAPDASFTPGTSTLGTGRWQLAASQATSQLSSFIPAGSTYIYALSGVAADGTTLVTDADAALVGTGGQLGTFAALSILPRAGYASTAAANFVYAFGGLDAQPDTGIVSGEMCGPGATCGAKTIPQIANWNNEGVAMTTPRYLPGGTLSGACIYLAGGVTAVAPLTLTPTTEYFLW